MNNDPRRARRRSLRWPFSVWPRKLITALAFAWLGGIFHARAQPPAPQTQPRPLAPFLDVFRKNNTVRVDGEAVAIPTAVGVRSGYLARPAGQERLPAMLLLGNGRLNEWMKQSTRELASIGYVVLALQENENEPRASARPATGYPALENEKSLAGLSAAVRWLRRRADVFPDRLGVAGWAAGGERALALAASTPLQACVVTESFVVADSALMAGLRGTPVLAIFAGKDAKLLHGLPPFQKALKASQTVHKVRVLKSAAPGFMVPNNKKEFDLELADEAWVEIYEFLGKYVEDAPENSPFVSARVKPSRASRTVATVADLMRSINGPGGVRATLIEKLKKEPSSPADWKRVRADAALIAETGALLQALAPPKGARSHWRDSAIAYLAAAEEIVAASDRRDYRRAGAGLKTLVACCMTCHDRHRR